MQHFEGTDVESYRQEKNTHRFNVTLEQAKYSEGNYATKISLYRELLDMIKEGVSLENQLAFIRALNGLCNARSNQNEQRLTLLRDLLDSALQIDELSRHHRTIRVLTNLINQDLSLFAIKDGDVVRIRHLLTDSYLSMDYAGNAGAEYLLGLEKSTNSPSTGACLFIVKTKQRGKALWYKDELQLLPLYAKKGYHLKMLAGESTLGLQQTSKRGKKESTLGVHKRGKDYFTFERNSLRDGPIASSSTLEIKHPSSDKKITIDTENHEFYVFAKPLRRRMRSFRRKEYTPQQRQRANDWGMFAIEYVSPLELQAIEFNQFDNIMKKADKAKNFTYKIRAYETASNLLNSRTDTTHEERVFAGIQKLFESRQKNNIKDLTHLRSFLCKAYSNTHLESRQAEIGDYLGQLSTDLTPLGIKFGDIVTLQSSHRGKRILWVHGESRFFSDKHLEILAAPPSNAYTKNGPQLFKLVSPNGVTGTISYGDQFELWALYAGGGKVQGSLGKGRKIWVNPSSYCGKSFYEAIVGPNNCSQANNGQQLFSFRPTEHDLFYKTLHLKNPVIPDHNLELWSQYYQRKVWINQSSLSHHNCHEILVGPNDDNFAGVNRTTNGQQLFQVCRPARKTIAAIANKDFADKLKQYYTFSSDKQKILHLSGMIRYTNTNEHLSRKAKHKLVQIISNLFTSRANMSAQDIHNLKLLLSKGSASTNLASYKNTFDASLTRIETEEVEEAVTKLLEKAEKQATYLAQIEHYQRSIPALKNPLAQGKYIAFLRSVHRIIKQQDILSPQELVSLKGLIDETLTINHPEMQRNEVALELAADFEATRKELLLTAQLRQASSMHGLEQISQYNEIVSQDQEIPSKQKVSLIKSLKGIFERKITEIKAIKDVLQKASKKVARNSVRVRPSE